MFQFLGSALLYDTHFIYPDTAFCKTNSPMISVKEDTVESAVKSQLTYGDLIGFVGFALGNVVGMYLAQNYEVPNLAKKIEDIKRDVEARKKPPSDK